MRWIALSLLLALPLPVVAQETEAERTDRGAIVAFLEDTLSGSGRQVILRGFEGALSSRATATQLTIADDEGIWLTLNDIVLDWSRSSLLAGQVDISELTAAEIVFARAPKADDSVPTPEASGFTIPDLPVSVVIEKISASRVVLGETVLGQPVEGSIEAALTLAGGSGSASVNMVRTDDGPDGQVQLDARFDKATNGLTVSLVAAEQAGGIAASLLDLPGTPAVDLRIIGDGPLTDFAAEVTLSSDGEERLAGTVALQGADSGGTGFAVDLGGDIAPLFIPQYAAFLGESLTFVAQGQRSQTGRISLTELDFQARSLSLRGRATIAPDGLPEFVDLAGVLRDPQGQPVLLPGFDAGVSLRAARVEVAYNAAIDTAWRAILDAEGVMTPSGSLALVDLRGSGRITRSPVGNVIGGTLTSEARGLALTDPNLAMALGDSVSLASRFWWQEGTGSFRVGALDLAAGPLTISASGEISGLDAAFLTRGAVRIEAEDISPLSGFAGRPLTGSGRIDLTGQGSPLAGDFDLQARLDGQDLTTGVAELDGLLRGPSSISVDMRRDTTGTTLRDLTLSAPSARLAGQGSVTSDLATLDLTLSLDDLARLGPKYGGGISGSLRLVGPLAQGAARIEAQVSGTGLRLGVPEADRLLDGASDVTFAGDLADHRLTIERLDVTTPGATLSMGGLLAASGSDLQARIALADLSRLRSGYGGSLRAAGSFKGTAQEAAMSVTADGQGLRIGQAETDRLLAGASKLTAAMRLDDGTLRIDGFRLDNPQVTAQATGRLTQDRRELALSGRLANLGLLLNEFPGPVTLSGQAVDAGNGYDLSLSATGPGGIDARISGRVGSGLRQANLTLQGSAQAGLANPFLGDRVISGPLALDLRLNGPLALSSLGGQIRLAGGRLADPAVPFSLENIGATATLSGGQARITADTSVSTGGSISVSGPVSLSPPFQSNIDVTLASVVLRDPQFYEARANGQLRVSGPLDGRALISGRIALPQTEIRIASTGLSGASMIEGLRHDGDRPAVRETRRRAGLLAEGDGTDARAAARRSLALDVEISAPNQLFVRGRGLDAELGGTLRLTGTTTDIVPSGAFNLIRGRLDILGRRLTLSEASLQLEGNFNAALRVVASSVNDSITSSVLIEGSVREPEVSFTSSPQLPQEEVLSQLLFGRRLESLSALQALQLANAVATLAGRGGDGIIGRLREGFGLDDLDVRTDDDGNAQLTAGKYLSENVYSEIVVDQKGKSTVNLNLDLSDSVTVKGRVGADGDTGIGLFYEKDY